MSNFLKLAAIGLATMTVTGGAASAADLGRPAPAAVDYVRICDAYGRGFFYIPGSETCMRIGGGVRFDVSVSQADFILNFRDRNPKYVGGYLYRNWNAISTLARARVDVETRTGTEFGLLRSLIRAEFENGSQHEPFDPVTLNLVNKNFQRTILREAYIQWGGFTAGLTYSLFNLPYFLTYSNPFTADQRTNMLAYTFNAGGFAASLALEDPTLGRRGFIGPYGLANLPGRSNYAGFKYPDLIGVLKYASPTLSIQASGALHHVNRDGYVYSVIRPNAPATDDWGWAAQIGAEWKFNTRGSIYGGLAHTEGMSSMSGLGADDDRLGGGTGFAATDGISRIRNGKFVPTRITSAHLGAGYGVTDKVRLAGSLGYARVDDDYRAIVGLGPLGIRGFRAGYDAYKVLGLVEWNPAENFRIGAEVGYTAIEFDQRDLAQRIPPAKTGNGFGYGLRNSDRLSILLRVDRRF